MIDEFAAQSRSRDKLRDNMLQSRQTGFEPEAIQLVFMDWHVGIGTATVMAAVDGTASVYLSSGGGYLGGGQRYQEIGDAAKKAVQLATNLKSQFVKTENFDLPPREDVAFFLKTSDGVYTATVKENGLRTGASSLAALGGAMQAIITGYRLRTSNPPAKN